MSRRPNITEAFHTLCKNATPAKGHYVSLYAVVPFYGGPEEGGWWGEDYELVAYHRCPAEAECILLRMEVQELAKELSANARYEFNRCCRNECAWLEERGLDDDFLPEPNGETRYCVFEEATPGEMASEGCRTYS